MALFVIFLSGLRAFTLSAICGGGAGLMLIPILGRLLPISQIPAALSIGTFTSSATRLVAFRKNINWYIVKFFVPAALPAVWLGAFLLKFLNPHVLGIIMGVFLISNLPFLFKKPKELKHTGRPANIMLVIIGFLAGFLSGVTGAVGLLFNRFYLRYGLTKEEIIATRAANEIILHLVKIILYTLFGLLSRHVLLMGTVVALSAVASTWTTKYILPRISDFVFRRVGYMAMVLSGFLMLGQSTNNLLIANNGNIKAGLAEGGFETKLKWQSANFALEFSYDEGFEFEQRIPLSELTAAHRQYVLSRHPQADRVIVEAVHAVGEKSYEAYYFSNRQLIDKIDFK
jgi:uncharacterized membrane protein YfcA